MPRSISWLHLSDLHACKPNTGWDAERVIDKLTEDIQSLEETNNLHPDFIFFTGDLAFGHVGDGDGKSISEQFEEGERFLSAVRNCFDPPIEKKRTLLVPAITM